MKVMKGSMVKCVRLGVAGNIASLTVGKNYEVVFGYGDEGLVLNHLPENKFRILDDDGDMISCIMVGCLFADWEVV